MIKLLRGTSSIVLVSLTILASATSYYSNSSSGDDLNPGTSALPFKTFHKAYSSASSGDTIYLDGTFTWTDADEVGDVVGKGYVISKNIVIRGSAADETIIQAASSSGTADRGVFDIDGAGAVTFMDLKIRNGRNSGGAGINTNNTGSLNVNLNLIRVAVYQNISTLGTGGGIIAHHSTTLIQNSTFSDNSAPDYGAAIYSKRGVLTITNSTFANNAGYSIIDCNDSGELVLTNSTVAYNHITQNFSDEAAVRVTNTATVYIMNDLLAQNKYISVPNPLLDFSSTGTLNDNGYNLIEGLVNGGISSGVNNNIVGPQVNLNLSSSLGPNASNTKTETLGIFFGSVAIDAGGIGNNGSVSTPSEDQRGGARSGLTDIGAFEFGAPIPVKLTLFDAEWNDQNSIRIFWQTATEIDNSHFNVQKSIDGGVSWYTIDKIEGQGNSKELHDYSTLDLNPEAIQYYRLVQVDFDGKKEISKVIRIERSAIFVFNLFPNPVLNQVEVHLGNSIITNLSLYNAQGVLIMEQTPAEFQSTSTLNMTDLDPGLYQIVIDTPEGKFSQKLIKS
ncbi:T9SS type A sorting domain-containing protein [bacterium]|nr:T9SS type A sorting domain-containing protein [bacterium]